MWPATASLQSSLMTTKCTGCWELHSCGCISLSKPSRYFCWHRAYGAVWQSSFLAMACLDCWKLHSCGRTSLRMPSRCWHRVHACKSLPLVEQLITMKCTGCWELQSCGSTSLSKPSRDCCWHGNQCVPNVICSDRTHW